MKTARAVLGLILVLLLWGSPAVAAPGGKTSSDLAIRLSVSPTPAVVGGKLTFEIRVDNYGPSKATDVKVSNSIPAGSSFISASTSQGTCSGTSTVSCLIGGMEPNASVDLSIAVRVDQEGFLQDQALVSSKTPDRVTSNNSAEVGMYAEPPTSLPTSCSGSATLSEPGYCGARILLAEETAVTLTLQPGPTYTGDLFGEFARWDGQSSTGRTRTVAVRGTAGPGASVTVTLGAGEWYLNSTAGRLVSMRQDAYIPPVTTPPIGIDRCIYFGPWCLLNPYVPPKTIGGNMTFRTTSGVGPFSATVDLAR